MTQGSDRLGTSVHLSDKLSEDLEFDRAGCGPSDVALIEGACVGGAAGGAGAGAGTGTLGPVCAVIVTYHPSGAMVENMGKILAQVQGLVAVDNGSSAEEVRALRAASAEWGLSLIENQENVGIAEALNRGIGWAKAKGFGWVVLFDQDSAITDDFVTQMAECWAAHPERERVASVHPRYVNPKTNLEPVVRRARDGGPIVSLTSGALMPVWVFDRIGGFASDYFIDEVDTEYCWRIRAAGYLVADSKEAVLLHSAGHPKPSSLLGMSFQPSHHSATRRYYMSRNRIVVYRKYMRVFPGWVFGAINVSLRETLKCFLGEEDRGRKLRSVLLGTWDGLTGRMGRRDGV